MVEAGAMASLKPTESLGDELADGGIIARDLVVKYGPVLALDHLTVDVPKGVVGLLGPNGAGKSTFIKTILGLLEPQGGQVTVAGLDSIQDKLRIRDRIGYMPEHDCLIETMTGIELVSYMGRMSGMTKKDSFPRSHEVLDFVGLTEQRYRPISTYSTGMKQRVKLAQAIVHDPAVIFLDEPTSGMDPGGREEMLELISRIAASDKSILLSSHILHDVERVCKHVIIISSGKVVTHGGVENLLSQGSERKRLVVRGLPISLKDFLEQIGKAHEIVSVSEEFKQVTVVLINKGGSRDIFEAAKRARVQIRSYMPDRFTLEDVFIEAVKEAR
jgi:ABC-2 type transport system ATP-binding protein